MSHVTHMNEQDGTKMNVIEFDSKNDLPLDYDPVCSRVLQCVAA